MAHDDMRRMRYLAAQSRDPWRAARAHICVHANERAYCVNVSLRLFQNASANSLLYMFKMLRFLASGRALHVAYLMAIGTTVAPKSNAPGFKGISV